MLRLATSNNSRRLAHSKRAMSNLFRLPQVQNEAMLDYAPGSTERANLADALARMKNECPDIPCVVGGKEIRTGNVGKQVMPTDRHHTLCTYHKADKETVQAAVDAAMAAKEEWEEMSYHDRATIFLRAAELTSTKYRADICAAVMLGTGKTVWQAEIDAAAEMIDFWRFNAKFGEQLISQQPPANSSGVWNKLEYRPLEGFVAAISPFNFCAIGSNLGCAPAQMGNTVVWKPASTAVLGNYVTLKILEEAGMPAGVLNFIPGSGPVVGDVIFNSPDLSGVHFTGSTGTFGHVWSEVSKNLSKYKSYPRLVGETGGKNFHLVHPSADLEHVVHNTLRAAFEYQGQKCSACSRAYIPQSMWPEFKKRLTEEMKDIKMGQPDDFSSFVTAVIDDKSFDNTQSYIEHAREDLSCEIIAGGVCDDSKGYFVEPTVIHTTDPHYKTMKEEIFAPVLTVYVFPDEKWDETVELVGTSSEYALTGSVFARDRTVINAASKALRNAAGNFYVNDKSTGAVVGQQPFGGARASGTNDKAGAVQNLTRWVSARTIKENLDVPLRGWKYPYMS